MQGRLSYETTDAGLPDARRTIRDPDVRRPVGCQSSLAGGLQTHRELGHISRQQYGYRTNASRSRQIEANYQGKTCGGGEELSCISIFCSENNGGKSEAPQS